MTTSHHDHMREVLTTDSAYTTRWPELDVTGIYAGPNSVDVAEVVDAHYGEYASGPLADPRARMALASATLGVLRHASEYNAVIGEDTTGRYPALVVGNAINLVRTEMGDEPARRLFVSGRIDLSRTRPDWQLVPGDETLVVTEYVNSGWSTKAVHDTIVAQSEVAPDYVVLGGNPEWCARRHEDAEIRRTSRVFTGDRNCYSDYADTLFCPGRDSWKGVTKQDGDAHSKRVASSEERVNVAASRREAALFATVLANYYLDAVQSD